MHSPHICVPPNPLPLSCLWGISADREKVRFWGWEGSSTFLCLKVRQMSPQSSEWRDFPVLCSVAIFVSLQQQPLLDSKKGQSFWANVTGSPMVAVLLLSYILVPRLPKGCQGPQHLQGQIAQGRVWQALWVSWYCRASVLFLSHKGGGHVREELKS